MNAALKTAVGVAVESFVIEDETRANDAFHVVTTTL